MKEENPQHQCCIWPKYCYLSLKGIRTFISETNIQHLGPIDQSRRISDQFLTSRVNGVICIQIFRHKISTNMQKWRVIFSRRTSSDISRYIYTRLRTRLTTDTSHNRRQASSPRSIEKEVPRTDWCCWLLVAAVSGERPFSGRALACSVHISGSPESRRINRLGKLLGLFCVYSTDS